MTYPEKIPSNNPVNSFNFSFSNVSKNKVKIESEISQIMDRVSAILDSEKFYIHDFPVLRQIYALGPNRSELKKLSKACDRLADLVHLIHELNSKMAVINMANDNPNWLAVAFGDFSAEIDSDIESFFNSIEE